MDRRLYIIMRRDIQDMNPGKAMAQAAHAQADFMSYMMEVNDYGLEYILDQWCEDRNFGTTTVLSADMDQIKSITDNIKHSGVTVDPTYPWRNWQGDVYTSRKVTCAWAFVFEPSEKEFMKRFDLHE